MTGAMLQMAKAQSVVEQMLFVSAARCLGRHLACSLYWLQASAQLDWTKWKWSLTSPHGTHFDDHDG